MKEKVSVWRRGITPPLSPSVYEWERTSDLEVGLRKVNRNGEDG